MGKTVRNESLYDDFDDNSYNYRGSKAQVKKKTNTLKKSYQNEPEDFYDDLHDYDHYRNYTR